MRLSIVLCIWLSNKDKKELLEEKEELLKEYFETLKSYLLTFRTPPFVGLEIYAHDADREAATIREVIFFASPSLMIDISYNYCKGRDNFFSRHFEFEYR